MKIGEKVAGKESSGRSAEAQDKVHVQVGESVVSTA